MSVQLATPQHDDMGLNPIQAILGFKMDVICIIKVKVHTIKLGSAGGISKNMDNLANVGIDKARCDIWNGNCTFIASHNIIKKSWSLEHIWLCSKLFRDERPKKAH